ncbi:MAG: hypothetical protein GY794_06245, partial [bacterium]|nr:hypothetical protein [bacterium]
VILPKMFIGKAWRFITDKAGDKAIKPAGMAARDILRIEAGLCRYGHELNETIDPFTAGLESLVDFEHEFIGRKALTVIRDKGVSRKRVGLLLDCPDAPVIARLGDTVYNSEGVEVGAVTSGTFSPALDCAIAMAQVSLPSADTGTVLQAEVASTNQKLTATVTDLPFVSPSA